MAMSTIPMSILMNLDKTIHSNRLLNYSNNVTNYSNISDLYDINFIEGDNNFATDSVTNSTTDPELNKLACNGAIVMMKQILFSCIIWMGLFGNSLALLILHVRAKNNTINLMLQVLAVVDNSYLLAVFLAQTMSNSESLRQYRYTIRQIGLFSRMAQFLSMWLIVLIGTIRYIAICRPFYVKIMCTVKRAMITVAILIVCDILIHIPQFNIDTTKLPWSDKYFKLFYFAVFYYIIMMFLLPFTLLIYMNLRLKASMKKIQGNIGESHKQVQHQVHQQEMRDVTRVVVAIITTFLITYSLWMLIGVLQITKILNPNAMTYFLSRKSCLYRFVMEFFLVFFTLINSSVNFLIYFFLRKSFRIMLRDLIPGKAARRASASDSVRTQSC